MGNDERCVTIQRLDGWLSEILRNDIDDDPSKLKSFLLRNTKSTGKPPASGEEFLHARAFEFQYLVRRFIIQLRYGCEVKSCTTPLCFTCRKRLDKVPVRRPSQLTARTIAFILASGEDPYDKLCPNHPVLLPQDLNLGEDIREAIFDRGELIDAMNLKVPHIIYWDSNDSENVALTDRGMLKLVHPTKSDAVQDYWVSSLPLSAGRNLDRKSLSQNLFDAPSVKSFEWCMGISTFPRLRRIFRSPESFVVGRTATVLPGNTPDPEMHAKLFSRFPNLIQSTSLTKMRDQRLYLDLELLPPASTAHFELVEPAPDTVPHLRISANGDLHSEPPPLISRPHNEAKNSTSAADGTADGTADGGAGVLIVANGHASVQQNSGKAPAVQADIGDRSPDASPQRMLRAYFINTSKPSHSKKSKAATEPYLNHLSFDGIRALRSLLSATESMDEKVKDKVWKYVDRSLFQSLGSAKGLLRSFSYDWDATESPVETRGDAFRWRNSMQDTIFNYLWNGIEVLFAPPPELSGLKSPKLRAVHHGREPTTHEYIGDEEAGHIIMICFFALVGSMPIGGLFEDVWPYVHANQGSGNTMIMVNLEKRLIPAYLEIKDCFENEAAVRLATRLVRAISARRAFTEMLRKSSGQELDKTQPGAEASFPLMDMVIDELVHVDLEQINQGATVMGSRMLLVVIDWIHAVILATWNGKSEVKRWDAAGAAIEILADLEARRGSIPGKVLTNEKHFEMINLDDRLDTIETALSYLQHKRNPNTFHLLNHRFLFQPSALVRLFRTLNFNSMTEAYQYAGYHMQLTARLSFAFDSSRHTFIEDRLKPALSRYLVLDVRREHLLEDTMNQLWGREKRELLRPLKVRMGMDQGEEGVDHGGVSQEFFRIVFEQAFDPDAGLFLIDPISRMSWFQPLSLEPLATYELLGLLMSLALYNGITLPTSFPLAFYSSLFNQPMTEVEDIEDGWPTLAKSFTELLNWEDGEVADIFMREYVFSLEANGRVFNIDMETVDKNSPWPGPPSEEYIEPEASGKEPSLVSNENRKRFVEDYLFWLTDKSIRPQFEAFSRGLFTCVDKRVLSILTPATLRLVAEGHHEFDVEELEKATRYESGYDANHWLIEAFWTIVGAYPKDKQKSLLEFVTSSDRVPVNGMQGLIFSIVRNGPDSERVPTSATCFGKLLLPEYSSAEKLKEKLDIALENSKGFGAL